MTAKELHLEQLHIQLVHWQENLASRVASEAESLDIEISRLLASELEDAIELLRTAHSQVLAGCDSVRDLRRRLQDRHGT